MSWSVSATGKPADVKMEMQRQFAFPLNHPPKGLSDVGERETVENVYRLIEQTLDTFDPEREVAVSASGHIGFKDYATKAGPYQQVNLSIQPR